MSRAKHAGGRNLPLRTSLTLASSSSRGMSASMQARQNGQGGSARSAYAWLLRVSTSCRLSQDSGTLHKYHWLLE